MKPRHLNAAVKKKEEEFRQESNNQAGTKKEKHKLPSIDSLGGKHPDFTGEDSTVDYVRKLRGDQQ